MAARPARSVQDLSSFSYACVIILCTFCVFQRVSGSDAESKDAEEKMNLSGPDVQQTVDDSQQVGLQTSTTDTLDSEPVNSALIVLTRVQSHRPTHPFSILLLYLLTYTTYTTHAVLTVILQVKL